MTTVLRFLFSELPRPDRVPLAGRDEGRVLVAEPCAALRGQIGLALRRVGLEVDFADDVDDALTLAGRHRYRVVVLDPDMQAGRGIELCRALSHREIAVIALSRSGSVLARLRARLAGAQVCLVRPLGLDRFVDAVSGFFAEPSSRLGALAGSA